ncbi:MAG: hypothetical protein ACE5JS_20750 [Nitrospinota bacterium]
MLFVSEAPSLAGGFYAFRNKDNLPVKDDLRENLFKISNENNCVLPDPHTISSMDAFLSKRFFLVQTVKWPLGKSAASLGESECRLIEHSAEDHLRKELAEICPKIIIPMGKVACYGSSYLLRGHGFRFKSNTRLEEVRGRTFCAQLDDRSMQVFPTGLPVKRRKRDFPRISEEINTALSAFGKDPP